MTDLDSLLDVVIAQAEIENGVDPRWLSKSRRVSPIGAAASGEISSTIQQWSEEEDRFLVEHIIELGYEGVAEALGRSVNAIKIRRVRVGLPAPSKAPGWLTMQQVARVIGNDFHSVKAWKEREVLTGFVTIPGERGITMLRKVTLYRFALNPENWCYFKQENVADLHLKRLIKIVAARWEDEWWTTGQIAEYFGLANSNTVQAAIVRGQLPGKKWGNWHVKRSDALAYRWYTGSGSGEQDWSPRADAFILRAHDEWKKPFADIARMMKWPPGKVNYRYHVLKEQSNEQQQKKTQA